MTIKVVGGDDGETGVTPEMESLKIETANFRVEDESKRNVTGDIEKLRSGKGSGVARARALYNLLVEGAKRLRPKQKKSRDAKFVYDGQPRHIGGGVYEFINARLEVRRPGKFRTQFIVQGIATDPTEKRYDSTIESFSKNAEEAIKWVNTVLFLFLTVLMFSGNNANTPRWRILLTLVAGGVTIALIPTLGNKTHAETWRIMMYMSVGVTALFAFLALTMSFIDKGRFATHAAKREASMVAYVQRLWNHPDEEDDGGNSLSASATEALTSHLKQIKLSLRDFSASISSGESRDAFYYPAKVIASFVVSTIVVVHMLVQVVNSGTKISEYVVSLNYKAVSTIFTYTIRLEEQYFDSQFSDLPAFYERWAYLQANSVDDAFRDFARVVEVVLEVSVIIAFVVFIASWVVFLADFRLMVMRARRGKFHFTHDKLKMFHAADYAGVHISSSVVTFLLISVMVSLVGVILVARALLKEQAVLKEMRDKGELPE